MTDKNTLSMHGQHVLVTGGSRGIGLAISRGFLQHGAKLTIAARSQSSLDLAKQSLLRENFDAAQMQFLPVDVSDQDSVSECFHAARHSFGGISILVNNAGQASSAPMLKTDLAAWQHMLNVNLTGSFLCSQQALPDMLKQGFGRIINIASTAGLKAYPYVTAYCAAKHGVIGLTRALALELASKGITVNAVCPGYTETDLLHNALQNIMAKTGRSEHAARAELAAHNPQGQLISPKQVADTVLWLALPASSAMTGQALAVAGGEVM